MRNLEANLSRRAFSQPMDLTKTKLITTTSLYKRSNYSNCGQSLNLKPWLSLTNNHLRHRVCLGRKDSLKVRLKKANLSFSYSIHNWIFLMACTKVQILLVVDLAQQSESSPTTMTMAWLLTTLCLTDLILQLAKPRTHQKQTKSHPNFHAAQVICQSSKNWNLLRNKSSKVVIKKKYQNIWCLSIHPLRENHAGNTYQNRLNGEKDLQLKHLWKLLTNFTLSTVWQMRKK